MRITRLLAVLLTAVSTALLAAPATAAEPPFWLPTQITDHVDALTDSGRAATQAAVSKLYRDHEIRLWVVFVDNFAGQDHTSWSDATRQATGLGDHDVLLAVATDTTTYDFRVPTAITTVTPKQVDDLRRKQIEPALHDHDWGAAAVAAANGLGGVPLPWGRVVLVLALVAVAGAVLWVVVRYLRRRRRAAQLAAARRVDPTDPDALAMVPLRALDGLSRSMVVDVDNAVRTSSNELALAVEEFGTLRTEPFTRAVEQARAALTQAFNVRQQLDDAIPETPEQRREMLTRAIVAAAEADRELEAQTEAFEQLRDLVINAPSRLDGLTQQLVELTARIPESKRRLGELRDEFDNAALVSVSSNVRTAGQRLSFADDNMTRARALAARAVAGGQSELVDAVRAAESALGQARALLDAVDSAAGDIRHAVAVLPGAVTDVQADIARADQQLARAGRHTADLTAARAAAVKAVAAARNPSDPLGAYTALSKVAADLDKLLAALAEEQATAERLNRALEQALFTAESRVRAVSDYIDTRRGSVGPEARTRLAEARRQLAAAQAGRSTDLTEAIGYANAAAALAAQAQSRADFDVRAAQRAYAARYRGGNDFGAMVGGIIIGNILGGGMRGGDSGGWTPTSFGGSSGSGGGFMGGGGRF